MNIQSWMNDALQKINTDIAYGETFTLKKLFDGVTWSKLQNGEPQYFGRYFSTEVREDRVPEVIACGKAKNGQSLYRKVMNGGIE